MNASELYQAGQLDEAITASVAAVKSKPTDVDARTLLCELLCFAGNLDRTDVHLDAITTQRPEAGPSIALFRQLVRAEQARQQFFDLGRMPEVIDGMTPDLKSRVSASIHLREGNAQLALETLRSADAATPKVRGVVDGKTVEDFRDLDDITASLFEVLTSTGKYFWIPIERVEQIEFHKPQRPRDLLWRPATMNVRGGPDGEVFIPTLYAGSHFGDHDNLKLGRATDWQGDDTSPVQGIGLRMYLVGDEAKTILQLTNLSFEVVAS